jgi:DNA-binding MarR family transcriptional regulator
MPCRTRNAALCALAQADLSRRLGIDSGDIVGTLNELERDGLAVRAPDDRDRRRNAIRITPAGIDALHALDDDVNQAQNALMEPLSAAERAQLNALLHCLLQHHYGWRLPE